ncbi:RNA polymerase factor sigma-54 [Coralloluteibacterium stylophorae]|uniref:RNA polymerase sigma-54 factor n=1 Tax=Coralloluteibacterium stylophorae TaxID=1776034 RepID=A0A8J7VU34_9GAMM|nr:RNA polymerase factor sigma-54 [Coralloluteibacterium stylophorae]MBS7457212.1 RNA polymerase factor sigma-54 [Coralloluteibacterium stylophorae]
MKAVAKTQLGQSLHLTPQLLQSIRLLQLNGMELEMELARVLEANPLLEREDEAAEAEDGAATGQAAEEAAAWDELPETAFERVRSGGDLHGDTDALAGIAAPESGDIRQRILAAARLELGVEDLAILAWLLDRIDDSGYLEAPAAEVAADGAARFDVAAARIEALRQRLLTGDPCGFGAESLAECLRAQLDDLAGSVPGRPLARRIVAEALDLLAAHDEAAIARRLGVEAADAAEAIRLVLCLEPRPGAELPADPRFYVVPDVIVRRVDGRLQTLLNPQTAPKVRVDAQMEALLATAGDDAGSQKMKELLAEGRGFARGLSMRYDTLLRATRAIVARQQAFFAEGEAALAPLTLKEIAEDIGMHESTISRITSGKYMQTPRGTIELKKMFCVKLDGAAVSGAAVRAMVGRLIAGERADAPLADETIAALLEREGVSIARRTVAKYREQLGLAPARLRKSQAGRGRRAA